MVRHRSHYSDSSNHIKGANPKPNNNSTVSDNMWSPEFNDALSSVRRTSRDSRVIIFALLTFMLINIVVLLNSLDGGWTKQRISSVRDALIIDCENNLSSTEIKNNWTTEYADKRNFMNCAELYRQFEALKEMYNNDILMIRVTIVGMRVDANWFTVVSSMGFSLLLGALFTSLNREMLTLKLADNKEIFKRAEMENFFPKWLAICIIWLPVIVVTGVFINDCLTTYLGKNIDQYISYITTLGGALGVTICIYIACKATFVLNKLNMLRSGNLGG